MTYLVASEKANEDDPLHCASLCCRAAIQTGNSCLQMTFILHGHAPFMFIGLLLG